MNFTDSVVPINNTPYTRTLFFEIKALTEKKTTPAELNYTIYPRLSMEKPSSTYY